MSGILLAPYNDSMRLGQGYNSFLHAPCIYDAMQVNPDRVSVKPASSNGSTSQAVNYSSRFVDKISDVVKSLNVSAGGSIKNGGIIGSSNTATLDEAKFAASDLNAIVSVKVVNQTSELLDTAVFKPLEGIKFTNESFMTVYGNCYISGFIEGGELVGIVSAKVLDVSKKTEVEEAIKSQVNTCSVASGSVMGFTLDETSGTTESDSESVLKNTETTITVSWSGGGNIKPEDEVWTLDSLYRAAAAFPANVAQCPQRTWAILTPYNHAPSFVVWAEGPKITVPQFQAAQVYANDLLDMYMEYKGFVSYIQDALANPERYTPKDGDKMIGTTIEALAAARKALKEQMRQIDLFVDKLALSPATINDIEKAVKIDPTETWLARLPTRKKKEHAVDKSLEKALEDFGFFTNLPKGSPDDDDPEKPPKKPDPSPPPVPPPSPPPPPPPVPPVKEPEPEPEPLFVPGTEDGLTRDEREVILAPSNRKKFNGFLFGSPVGRPDTGFFCDAFALSHMNAADCWPTSIRFTLNPSSYKDHNGYNINLLDLIRLEYPNKMSRTHGYRSSREELFTLKNDEYVVKVSIRLRTLETRTVGIDHLQFTLNTGKTYGGGSVSYEEFNILEWTPPKENMGLVGFFGEADVVVHRLGPIWKER